MNQPRARLRPPTYPPPEFPPRRQKPFARTPPAIFPAILGMIGLGLALRRGLAEFDLSQAAADLMLGAAAALWGFAAMAYVAKIAQRPGVVAGDAATLPGRAGLSAASMGLMALATGVAPFSAVAGLWMLFAGLVLHAAVMGIVTRAILRLPPEGRGVTPVFHMHYAGFIVGGVAAAALGLNGLALVILCVTVPAAIVIWAISLWQLWTRIPPAPLRPLLAIHLAPASLFATTAAMIGLPQTATLFGVLAGGILVALVGAGRWIFAAPFTPLWAALTFPLAATVIAALSLGGSWAVGGLVLSIPVAGAIPAICWKVLKLWPGGRLAALTNAAAA